MFAVTATVFTSEPVPFDALTVIVALKDVCTEQSKLTSTSGDPFAGTDMSLAPSVSAGFDADSVTVNAAPLTLVMWSVPIFCGHAVMPTLCVKGVVVGVTSIRTGGTQVTSTVFEVPPPDTVMVAVPGATHRTIPVIESTLATGALFDENDAKDSSPFTRAVTSILFVCPTCIVTGPVGSTIVRLDGPDGESSHASHPAITATNVINSPRLRHRRSIGSPS